MLGKNIITYRKKLGLSQQQLADRMNVVRQTVSKWEKELSVPDADALVRLADVLDVTVPQLLGEAGEPQREPGEYASLLAQLNEQLATQNRRRNLIWKIVAWTLGILLALNLLNIVSSIFYVADFSTHQEVSVVQTTEAPAVE